MTEKNIWRACKKQADMDRQRMKRWPEKKLKKKINRWKKNEHTRLAASIHPSSVPIRWSVVKKSKQNFTQPGLSSPNEVKLHFAFHY